jgi:Uma2 family endonuclease
MSTASILPDRPVVVYPESDGQPIAENTRQYEWIVTIKGNLDVIFRDDPQVFIAGDLFWYPVEGDNTIRQAPDTLVVFGRPKGHRGSYRQWEENGIAPQVVFEILSPSNRHGELVRKFKFYERYGVEEYYVYDPDCNGLSGWQRQDGELREIASIKNWVSPRLGIRFEHTENELTLYRPDGGRFATFLELAEQAEHARQQAELAQQQAEQAQQQAEQARQQAEQAQEKADRLAAQLRSLGVEPEA